jgi:hypothetical protein
VDLLAVDRRDEGLVQQAVDLGRDPVRLALALPTSTMCFSRSAGSA